MSNVLRLHRVLKTTPDRAFRAFVDPAALPKWLPPDGFTGTVHAMDARPGGSYRMSFTNFGTGGTHVFGGTYTEFVPGERLVIRERFETPEWPDEMTKSIDFKAVSVGVELTILHEGFPDSVPPETCYLGWQDSLTLLARLVEADVPG